MAVVNLMLTRGRLQVDEAKPSTVPSQDICYPVIRNTGLNKNTKQCCIAAVRHLRYLYVHHLIIASGIAPSREIIPYKNFITKGIIFPNHFLLYSQRTTQYDKVKPAIEELLFNNNHCRPIRILKINYSWASKWQ